MWTYLSYNTWPYNTKKDGSMKAKKEVIFAEGFCLKKIFWVFLFGCVFGCVFEMITHFLQHGEWVSRRGLIYGPLNPVYGIGAVLFTLLTKQKNIMLIFISGALLGGSFEYICSLIQEYIFGTISWDYSHKFLNIGGRTSLFYMVCWGILSVIFVKLIYPPFSNWIEKFPVKFGNILTLILLALVVLDCTISILACHRHDERRHNEEPSNQFEVFLDKTYPDERLAKIFENAKEAN